MGSPCPSNIINFDNIQSGNIIEASEITQVQKGAQQAELYWDQPIQTFETISEGEIITAQQIIQIQNALLQLNGCTCNCNNSVVDPLGSGCACQCNYCTCQCNYSCTCQCNYTIA